MRNHKRAAEDSKIPHRYEVQKNLHGTRSNSEGKRSDKNFVKGTRRQESIWRRFDNLPRQTSEKKGERPQRRKLDNASIIQSPYEELCQLLLHNANSLVIKLVELNNLAVSEGLDIIAIFETWAKPKISDAEYAINYGRFQSSRN